MKYLHPIQLTSPDVGAIRWILEVTTCSTMDEALDCALRLLDSLITASGGVKHRVVVSFEAEHAKYELQLPGATTARPTTFFEGVLPAETTEDTLKTIDFTTTEEGERIIRHLTAGHNLSSPEEVISFALATYARSLQHCVQPGWKLAIQATERTLVVMAIPGYSYPKDESEPTS